MHDECVYFLITEFMSCCVLLCSVSLCPSEYTASTNRAARVYFCVRVCVVSQYLNNLYFSIPTTPYLWCVWGREKERGSVWVCVYDVVWERRCVCVSARVCMCACVFVCVCVRAISSRRPTTQVYCVGIVFVATDSFVYIAKHQNPILVSSIKTNAWSYLQEEPIKPPLRREPPEQPGLNLPRSEEIDPSAPSPLACSAPLKAPRCPPINAETILIPDTLYKAGTSSLPWSSRWQNGIQLC